MKRRLALWLLACLAVLGVGWGCATPDIEAGLLLADVAAGATSDTLLKRITPQPSRRQVVIEAEGRRWSGDLHVPGEPPKAALVLVPGAAPAGKDDPRLVAFATSLARARFLVLVPDIASLRALAIGSTDAVPIADSVRWLDAAHRPAGIGIAAISYAAMPALLAALEPDVAPRLDFVLTIGAAFDIHRVVAFFTTGFHRADEAAPWLHQAPNAYGKWVFVRANIHRLDDSADRALLDAIARRRMAAPDAPVADLEAGLTPQGRAVIGVLENRDLAAVPELLARLPPAIRDEMARLDLSRRDFSGLGATIIALHGRDDRIVPWTESVRLARAAPNGRLVLLDGLAHADLGPGGLADTWTLWRAAALLLEERDRVSGS